MELYSLVGKKHEREKKITPTNAHFETYPRSSFLDSVEQILQNSRSSAPNFAATIAITGLFGLTAIRGNPQHVTHATAGYTASEINSILIAPCLSSDKFTISLSPESAYPTRRETDRADVPIPRRRRIKIRFNNSIMHFNMAADSSGLSVCELHCAKSRRQCKNDNLSRATSLWGPHCRVFLRQYCLSPPTSSTLEHY